MSEKNEMFDKIFNEDCLDGMARIPEKSIDAIICDLPYGKTKCSWDIVIPMQQLWPIWWRICKENAPIVLFGTEPFSSIMRLSNIKDFKYDWIWNKRNASGFLNAKKQPLRTNEIISVFYKKQCTYNPQMSEDRHKVAFIYDGTITDSEIYNKCKPFYRRTEKDALAYPKSVLNFTGVVNSSKEKVGHPTQKPVALLEYLVKTYTNEGDIVLDCCIGSGTTAIACIKNNRRFIGFELEKKYYDIAMKRIKEAQQTIF